MNPPFALLKNTDIKAGHFLHLGSPPYEKDGKARSNSS